MYRSKMEVYSKAEQKNIARRNLEYTYVYKGKLFKLAPHDEERQPCDFITVKGYDPSTDSWKNIRQPTYTFPPERKPWTPKVKSKQGKLPPWGSSAAYQNNIRNGKNYKLDNDEQKTFAARKISMAKHYDKGKEINEELMNPEMTKHYPSFASIRNSSQTLIVKSESLNITLDGNQQKKPVKPKTQQQPWDSNKNTLTVYQQKTIVTKNIRNAYDNNMYKLDDDIQISNEELMSQELKTTSFSSPIRNIEYSSVYRSKKMQVGKDKLLKLAPDDEEKPPCTVNWYDPSTGSWKNIRQPTYTFPPERKPWTPKEKSKQGKSPWGFSAAYQNNITNGKNYKLDNDKQKDFAARKIRMAKHYDKEKEINEALMNLETKHYPSFASIRSKKMQVGKDKLFKLAPHDEEKPPCDFITVKGYDPSTGSWKNIRQPIYTFPPEREPWTSKVKSKQGKLQWGFSAAYQNNISNGKNYKLDNDKQKTFAARKISMAKHYDKGKEELMNPEMTKHYPSFASIRKPSMLTKNSIPVDVDIGPSVPPLPFVRETATKI